VDDIGALVFDVFGTVVDWRSGVARDARRALPGVDAEAFADAWRERSTAPPPETDPEADVSVSSLTELAARLGA
jgi:2-haloacid dehalogenase